MPLGDGIRRNVAHVEPSERAALKNAIIEMHTNPIYRYPGSRDDTPPGGVSWWFKQDEIHQSTHVHGGPEFLPWHREITNRFEGLLRQINPQLSLHYWDFKEDPRNIPDGNIGGGAIGTVNLFDSNFMGSSSGSAGDPWLLAGFYDPQAGSIGHPRFRGNTENDRLGTNNPFDSPKDIRRTRPPAVPGALPEPYSTAAQEAAVLANVDYPAFRSALEDLHDLAHRYYAAVSPHIAFRDPFVFLLHSNIDRLYAQWQTDPSFPRRLDPNSVYGVESNLDVSVPNRLGEIQIQNLTHLVEPWSTGNQVSVTKRIRPWETTNENQGTPHDYHHISVVTPPRYDTNHPSWLNLANPKQANVRTPMGAVTVMDTPTSPQRPHVFVEGDDGFLWCCWYPGSGDHWNWNSLDKPRVKNVNLRAFMGAVTVMDTPTSLQRGHVFVECSDFNLWCCWFPAEGGHWNWDNLRKPQVKNVNLRAFMGAVTVMDTPTSLQRVHVFVECNDFNVWCCWYPGSGGNWNWNNLGKPSAKVNVSGMVGAITVMDTPTSPQQPFLFVTGNDGELWRSWYPGSGTLWTWRSLGRPNNNVKVRTPMGVVTVMDTPTSPQRPHVFVEGDDGILWCCWYPGSGDHWNWNSLGKPRVNVNLRAFMGAVTVMDTPTSLQRAHVFVECSDFNLWCCWFPASGGPWKWTNLGKPERANLSGMVGAVTVMDQTTSPQRPHVFVAGNDRNLWCDWWSDGELPNG